MSDTDPVRFCIAICEHLATKGMLNQKEFDEIIKKSKKEHKLD